MSTRKALRTVLVFAWAVMVLTRVEFLVVGGAGSGANKKHLSAFDILGHATLAATRMRNLPMPLVKRVLATLAVPGEVSSSLRSLSDLTEVRATHFTDAPDAAVRYVNDLEREPMVKRVLKAPQVDVALPLCALAVVVSALLAVVLPKEASLAVAIASVCMVMLAQKADPTTKAALGLQYVVILGAISSVL